MALEREEAAAADMAASAESYVQNVCRCCTSSDKGITAHGTSFSRGSSAGGECDPVSVMRLGFKDDRYTSDGEDGLVPESSQGGESTSSLTGSPADIQELDRSHLEPS